MEEKVRFSIVIPVYNEEEVLSEAYRRLTAVMRITGEPYELLFVNDGSFDRTGEFLEELAQGDQCVRVLEFTRNFGHEMAITAGIDHARGDAVVIIDGDLQDPPELIPEMIGKWREGYEVVYTRRLMRKGETLLKKWTSLLFYRTLRLLTNVDIPVDTGDFRLIDRKVCDVMRGIRERNRFVRGLVSWTGFRGTTIGYVRDKRFAGVTKYSCLKMMRFSIDGFTSFSYMPLKLAAYAGLIVFTAGLAYLAYILYLTLFIRDAVAGWAPLAACMMILNGFILLMLGVLGEYIGRIYEETKKRPLYVIRDKTKERQ